MPRYVVSVTIGNKPGIADPEGSTILNDLVLRGGYSDVSEIRSARTLRFVVDGTDGDAAEGTVQRICDDLRIYNPMVSRATYETRPHSD